MTKNFNDIPLSEILKAYENKHYNTRTKNTSLVRSNSSESKELEKIISEHEKSDMKNGKKKKNKIQDGSVANLSSNGGVNKEGTSIVSLASAQCREYIAYNDCYILNSELSVDSFLSRLFIILCSRNREYFIASIDREFNFYSFFTREKYAPGSISKSFIVDYVSGYNGNFNFYLNEFNAKSGKRFAVTISPRVDFSAIPEKYFSPFNQIEDNSSLEKLTKLMKEDENHTKLKDSILAINRRSLDLYLEHRFTSNYKDVLLKEALIKPSDQESYVHCIILFQLSDIFFFIKSYTDGSYKWISNPKEIKINESKGKSSLYSIRCSSSFSNFQLYLNFGNSNSNCVNAPSISTLRSFDLIKFISESSCLLCTYKIESLPYIYCYSCFSIFHLQCNTTKITTDSNGKFQCDKCKSCKFCLLRENPFCKERLQCRVCDQISHLQCLNPIFSKSIEKSILSYWKCDDCLECKSCKVSMKEIYQLGKDEISNPNFYLNTLNTTFTWSNDFDFCSPCHKKYLKKEYCAICNKLWNCKDGSLIECKVCKLYSHRDCERSKKSDYNCPKCRIKIKQQTVKSILQELKQLDTAEVFHSVEELKKDPTYAKVIKSPMGFDLMMDKVNKSEYLEDWTMLESDFNQIIANAQISTKPNDQIFKISQQLSKEGEKILREHSTTLMYLSLEYYLLDKLVGSESLRAIDEQIVEKFSRFLPLLNMKKVSKYFTSNDVTQDQFPKTFLLLASQPEAVSNQEVKKGKNNLVSAPVADSPEPFVVDLELNLNDDFEINLNLESKQPEVETEKKKRKKRKVDDFLDQGDLFKSNFDLSTLNKSANPQQNSFMSCINKSKSTMVITETHHNFHDYSYSVDNYLTDIIKEAQKENLILFYPNRVKNLKIFTDQALVDYFAVVENLVNHSKLQKKKDKKKESLNANTTNTVVDNNTNTTPANPDSQLLHNKRINDTESSSVTIEEKNLLCKTDDFHSYALFPTTRTLYDLPVRAYISNLDLLFESNCYLCGSFNDPESLVSCAQCFEIYHSFCAKGVKLNQKYFWLHENESVNVKSNTCTKCVKCYKCSKNTNIDKLFNCYRCNRYIHSYCFGKFLKISEVGSEILCEECFDCYSCHSKEYYKDNFPLDVNKDYTGFMRLFRYCIECGFEKYYYSKCDKCLQSNYSDLSKEYLQVVAKQDFNILRDKVEQLEKSHLAKPNSIYQGDFLEDNFIVMLFCDKCNSWFHAECVSFDFPTLEGYFDKFEVFTCLECHLQQLNQEKVENLVYLEVTRKSFKYLCFYKIFSQLLQLITKGSNLKLHTKLIGEFTREKFESVSSDKDFQLIAELVRLDSIRGEESNLNTASNIKEKKDKSEISKSISLSLQNKLNSKVKISGDTFSTNKFNFYNLNKLSESSESVKPEYRVKMSEDYLNKLETESILNSFFNIYSIDSIFKLAAKNNSNSSNLGLSLFDDNSTMVSLFSCSNEQENSEFIPTETKKNYEDKSLKNSFRENFTNTRPRLHLIKSRKVNFDMFLKRELKKSNPTSFSNPMMIYSFDINKYLSEVDEGLNYEYISEKLFEVNNFIVENSSKKKFFPLYRKFVANLIVKVISKLKLNFFNWLISYITSDSTNTLRNSLELTKPNPSNLSWGLQTDLASLDIFDPLLSHNSLSSLNSIICEVCHRCGPRVHAGRLIPLFRFSWVHSNCLYWSKGIIFDSSVGAVTNISNLLSKSKYWKCEVCRKYNATIQCQNSKCTKYFHYTCGLIAKAVFDQNKVFFCSKECGSQTQSGDENNKRRLFVTDNFSLKDAYIGNAIPIHQENSVLKIGNTCIIKLTEKVVTVLKTFEIEGEKYALLLSGQFKKFLVAYIDSYLSDEVLDLLDAVLNREEVVNMETNSWCISRGYCKYSCKQDEEAVIEYISSIHPRVREYFNYLESVSVSSSRLADILKFFNLDLPYSVFFLNPSMYKQYSVGDVGIKVEFKERIKFKQPALDKSNKVKTEESTVLSGKDLKDSKPTTNPKTKAKEIPAPSIANNKQLNKENKKKISFVDNMILKNTHNRLFNSFKHFNYLENNQQMKASRKHIQESEEPKTQESKKKKPVEKAILNSVASNNEIPLAIKYLNYKKEKLKVTIGPSNIHRNGLFALADFNPGDIVIEYVGEIISNKVADYREKEYNLRGFGDCYMFRIDNISIIDASQYGNLARFINHSCDPNCYAESKIIKQNKHIFLYAKRPIKCSEEVTYDYNFECEEEKIQCRCGAINCQGRLN